MLFHHYNKLLYPFAVKLTRSSKKKEEVLQEVFLKIWAHRGKLADGAPSPEQSFFYRETEVRLHQAIEQLPQSCRQIYRMSREQYKRIPEIASELNPSHNTVKNQLVKALKSIRLATSAPAKPTPAADITPGGNKATLTLADNTTIDLDEAKDGILAQQGNAPLIKHKDGQLSYRPAGPEASTAAIAYNLLTTPRGGTGHAFQRKGPCG